MSRPCLLPFCLLPNHPLCLGACPLCDSLSVCSTSSSPPSCPPPRLPVSSWNLPEPETETLTWVSLSSDSKSQMLLRKMPSFSFVGAHPILSRNCNFSLQRLCSPEGRVTLAVTLRIGPEVTCCKCYLPRPYPGPEDSCPGSLWAGKRLLKPRPGKQDARDCTDRDPT